MNVLIAIKTCLDEEFLHLKDKFELNEMEKSVNKTDDKYKIATKPGVYIISCENEILKVGRNFENAAKRAFEHFRDNTGDENTGKINSITENKPTMIYIYNSKNRENDFWLASLEIYLENKLKPRIKSKRNG